MLRKAEAEADSQKPLTEFHDEAPFVIPTTKENPFFIRITERPICITLLDGKVVKIFYFKERNRVCMTINSPSSREPSIFDLSEGEYTIDSDRNVIVKIRKPNKDQNIIAEIENCGRPLFYGIDAIVSTIKGKVERAMVIAKDLNRGESCTVRWGGNPILVMTQLNGMIGRIIQEGQKLYLSNPNSSQRISLHEGIQFIGRQFQNDGFFGIGQKQYFVADRHLSIQIQRHPGSGVIYLRFQVLDVKSGARIILEKM